ncbi:SusC/RagA family TonB-linked outer membrane protein [Sphingobacterium corticis]|uniref:SusC/RagA family TonB-linked outer membrane protein n=1 Tax=Sphingobacterium corticis TaxID=1812823 RepID=A0ABW5NL75_9SPHI
MRRFHYVLLLLLFNVCFSYAQEQRSLTGQIVDESGNPIQGATISLSNSQEKYSSNQDGQFALRYTPSAIITVNSVGHLVFTQTLTNQTTLTVRLQTSSEELEQVVVVGYGTQRKGETTGSVASVKSESFNQGAVVDAGQLIQGKVAGLRITTPSGNPNATTQINLRGLNSIQGAVNPLVIIDGVPGEFNSVAPEDIESVDVMKDGSAAAIYGTRATGGVIFITTKQNRSTDGRTSIDYNNYASLQTLFRVPDLLTAEDYRRLIAEGKNYEDLGHNTNWIDEVTQNPFSHNHNLTLFGGNSRTNFTGSVNYRDWGGVLLRSGQERLNVRADLNHDMFDGKLRSRMQIISNTISAKQGGSSDYMWRQAMIRNPTDRIYNDNGKWQESNAYMYDNPLGMIHETTNDRMFRETRMNGSLDYRPTTDLSFKALFSRVQDNDLTGTATSFDHVNTTKNNLNGTATRWTQAGVENLMEITANYNKSIGDHRIIGLAGYSWQRNMFENFNVYNFNFPTDQYSYNKLESGLALQNGLATMQSYKQESTLIGYFARANYSYKEKYLAMASIRREGSSTFGENNKWGNFPAVQVGWDMAKEDFMAGQKVINQWKWRAGYGVTGTIAASPYNSQISYNYTLEQGAYINGSWVPGFVPARNFNPDLRWERKNEFNIGADFSLFNNRVYGAFDYYSRNVKDLLYMFEVPVPPYLTSTMFLNAGEMKNSGFEALVNVDVLKKERLNWRTSFVFSTNKNKLLNLSNDRFGVTQSFFDTGYTGEPIQTFTHRVQVGRSIGDFYVLKTVGVDEAGKWLVEGRDGAVIPIQDATIEDRQYYGNGIPDFNIGWNNSFQYGNLDLTLNWRGAFGHQILNMTRMNYENPINTTYNALRSSYDPVYGRILNNDLVYVSHYIENGDFVKLDNATIGYTFDKQLIKGIKSLRIYISGLNLITITGYKGLDPEATSYEGDFQFAPGIEHRDRYPTVRTYTAGLNVRF